MKGKQSWLVALVPVARRHLVPVVGALIAALLVLVGLSDEVADHLCKRSNSLSKPTPVPASLPSP